MTITAVHVLATPDEEREADVAGGAPVELTAAFTDLEDFTTYTEAEGDEAARRLLIGHHRDSESIVRSRGGRVLKRLGDGLMLTFRGASLDSIPASTRTSDTGVIAQASMSASEISASSRSSGLESTGRQPTSLGSCGRTLSPTAIEATHPRRHHRHRRPGVTAATRRSRHRTSAACSGVDRSGSR